MAKIKIALTITVTKIVEVEEEELLIPEFAYTSKFFEDFDDYEFDGWLVANGEWERIP